MFPDLLRDDIFRLETRRLWLRWPRAADAAAIETLASDREVAEMTAMIPHPYPQGGAEGFVLSARAANFEGKSLTLALEPKSRPGHAIGCVEVRVAKSGLPEIGYWLGKPHWGDGLMTEAVCGLINLTWRVTGARKIQANAMPVNGASRRVLEKCGFVATGEKFSPAPARGGSVLVETFELARDAGEFSACA
jgi:RimJ/RimL family protein N-acetyltransferase